MKVEYINLYKKLSSYRVVFMLSFGVTNTLVEGGRRAEEDCQGKEVELTGLGCEGSSDWVTPHQGRA